MEASSHGLAQFRLDGVKLSAAAFTNLTQDHLDYHADFAEYREAKRRLFEVSPKGALAVISADSDETASFEDAANAAGSQRILCGLARRRPENPRAFPTRNRPGDGHTLWGKAYDITLPLIGEFQALNALAAAGLAIGLGAEAEQVFAALETLTTVKGRLEFVGETAKGAAVFVDYAHTPDGLDVLLRAARPHTAGKLKVIFGCGGDRDPYKRPMMGEVAARLADEAIVTDDNPRSEEPASIRKAILAACPNAIEIGDRAEAIRTAIAGLEHGDTLLIAGKGHETGQIIGSEIIPFSDQDTARDAMEAELC